jgi:hypothetical protein
MRCHSESDSFHGLLRHPRALLRHIRIETTLIVIIEFEVHDSLLFSELVISKSPTLIVCLLTSPRTLGRVALKSCEGNVRMEVFARRAEEANKCLINDEFALLLNIHFFLKELTYVYSCVLLALI